MGRQNTLLGRTTATQESLTSKNKLSLLTHVTAPLPPPLAPPPCPLAPSSSITVARWIRDGVNLRLEIGICSMGPADSRTLPDTPTTQAATPAAAAEEQPAKKRRVQQQESVQQLDQEGQQEAKEGHWPEKRLEIVAASAVAAGAEVHNTYVSRKTDERTVGEGKEIEGLGFPPSLYGLPQHNLLPGAGAA